MKNDILRFEETQAGLTVFYRNCYLYSRHKAATIPRTIVAQTKLSPHTLVFVPSLGLGYGLPELLQKLPAHCHIICVEEDEFLFKACLEKIGESKWLRDKRLSLYCSCSINIIRDFFSKLPISQFKHFVSLNLCQAYRLANDFYLQLGQTLENEIRHYWQNKLTLIYLGQRYVRNLFTNLPLLSQASDLTALEISKPILVCGAGPGLEKSIPLIKAFRQYLCLLAVDTALPVLTASNLTPDLVFVLEPQWHNLADFLSSRTLDFKLIAELASTPPQYSDWEFPKTSSGSIFLLPILQISPYSNALNRQDSSPSPYHRSARSAWQPSMLLANYTKALFFWLVLISAILINQVMPGVQPFNSWN